MLRLSVIFRSDKLDMTVEAERYFHEETLVLDSFVDSVIEVECHGFQHIQQLGYIFNPKDWTISYCFKYVEQISSWRKNAIVYDDLTEGL